MTQWRKGAKKRGNGGMEGENDGVEIKDERSQ